MNAGARTIATALCCLALLVLLPSCQSTGSSISTHNAYHNLMR